MPGSATDEAPALKALALSKLKCQVEELQQHNGHLTADNEGLRQKITALQQACDESLTKQSALQLAHRQQVAELEDAVHNLRQKLADACSSAEEQQGQVAAARQEVTAVLAGRERRCQELRAEVAALKKQLVAKDSEADSLSRRVGAVNNLTTAFEQELESLQQGMRRLQERVAQQDATIKQHEKRLLQTVKTGEGLGEQLETQGELLQAAQTAERSHAEAMRALEQQLDACKAEASAWVAKLQQEQEHRQQHDAATHQQQLAKLTEQLQQASSETASAQAATADLTVQHQLATAAVAAQAAALESERNAAVHAFVIVCSANTDLMHTAAASILSTRAAAATAASTAATEAASAAAAAATQLAAVREALAAANAKAEAAEEAEALARAEAAAAAAAAATGASKAVKALSQLQQASAAASAAAVHTSGMHHMSGANVPAVPAPEQQLQQHGTDVSQPSSGSKRSRAAHGPLSTHPVAHAAVGDDAAGASPTHSAAAGPAAGMPSEGHQHVGGELDEPLAVKRCMRSSSTVVGQQGLPVLPHHSHHHQQQQQQQEYPPEDKQKPIRPAGAARPAISVLSSLTHPMQHSSNSNHTTTAPHSHASPFQASTSSGRQQISMGSNGAVQLPPFVPSRQAPQQQQQYMHQQQQDPQQDQKWSGFTPAGSMLNSSRGLAVAASNPVPRQQPQPWTQQQQQQQLQVRPSFGGAASGMGPNAQCTPGIQQPCAQAPSAGASVCAQTKALAVLLMPVAHKSVSAAAAPAARPEALAEASAAQAVQRSVSEGGAAVTAAAAHQPSLHHNAAAAPTSIGATSGSTGTAGEQLLVPRVEPQQQRRRQGPSQREAAQQSRAVDAAVAVDLEGAGAVGAADTSQQLDQKAAGGSGGVAGDSTAHRSTAAKAGSRSSLLVAGTGKLSHGSVEDAQQQSDKQQQEQAFESRSVHEQARAVAAADSAAPEMQAAAAGQAAAGMVAVAGVGAEHAEAKAVAPAAQSTMGMLFCAMADDSDDD